MIPKVPAEGSKIPDEAPKQPDTAKVEKKGFWRSIGFGRTTSKIQATSPKERATLDTTSKASMAFKENVDPQSLEKNERISEIFKNIADLKTSVESLPPGQDASLLLDSIRTLQARIENEKKDLPEENKLMANSFETMLSELSALEQKCSKASVSPAAPETKPALLADTTPKAVDGDVASVAKETFKMAQTPVEKPQVEQPIETLQEKSAKPVDGKVIVEGNSQEPSRLERIFQSNVSSQKNYDQRFSQVFGNVEKNGFADLNSLKTAYDQLNTYERQVDEWLENKEIRSHPDYNGFKSALEEAKKSLEDKKLLLATHLKIQYAIKIDILETNKPPEGSQPAEFENWLFDMSATLVEYRDFVVDQLVNASEEEKKSYGKILESLGEKHAFCDAKMGELFDAQLQLLQQSKKGNPVVKIFNDLQNLVGKKNEIPSSAKLTLLGLLRNEETLKDLSSYLSEAKELKNDSHDMLTLGLMFNLPQYPDFSQFNPKLKDVLLRDLGKIDDGSTINEFRKKEMYDLHSLLMYKIGLQPVTQPLFDGLALAVKSEVEIMNGPAASIARRFLNPHIRNRTIPQVFSSQQERELLEHENYHSFSKGIMTKLQWEPLANGDAMMTFTVRVGGSHAKEVTPQTISSVMKLSKVPEMDRFAVTEFVRQFNDPLDKTDPKRRALEEKNLGLLKSPLREQLDPDPEFWKWIDQKERTDSTAMKEKEAKILATFRSLMDVAQEFVREASLKFYLAHLELGEEGYPFR